MKNAPTNIPDKEIYNLHDIYGNELICELRKTVTVLYGIFTEIVRSYYSKDNRMLKGVPDVKFSMDPQQTGIWIDTELRWEDEHPEFRPAIFVRLDGIQYESPFGLGNHYGMQMQDSEYNYSRIGKGTVSFVHIGNTSGEANYLCDNTATFLNEFSEQIKNDYCFLTFGEASRSPLQKYQKDSKEKYACITTFSYSFEENWTIKKESVILKSVDIKQLTANNEFVTVHNEKATSVF